MNTSPRISLTVLLLCGVSMLARGQDATPPKPLSPEVIAILGDPNATPLPTPDLTPIIGSPEGPRRS
jgi:hypothetical protein